MKAKTAGYAGAIYLSKSTLGVQSAGNVFRFCTNTNTGSVFYISETILTDTGSELTSNGAIYGGAIYINKATVTLTSTRIHNNMAYNGGGILFDNGITALLN